MMKVFAAILFAAIALASTSCSLDSAQKRYLLAERLWETEKYRASVKEFERAANKDPRGATGLRAVFRAAETQALFLNEFDGAIDKFRAFVGSSADQEKIREANLYLGEIFFNHLQRYSEALAHYKEMRERYPEDPNREMYIYRVGQCYFFLQRFDEAVEAFTQLSNIKEPTEAQAKWVEKAALSLAETQYTRGEQSPGGQVPQLKLYEDAIRKYQDFLKRFPESHLAPQAHFGIGQSYEELDQLDKAAEQYTLIESSYPTPEVIKVRLVRVKERLAQRKR